MTIHHPPKKRQQSDRLAQPDFRTDEYQRQKIANRFGVSLATAGTIVANAGFSDGERL